jgi:hypothetical protein
VRHQQREQHCLFESIFGLLQFCDVVKSDVGAGVDHLPFQHFNEVGVRAITVRIAVLQVSLFLFAFIGLGIGVFRSI